VRLHIVPVLGNKRLDNSLVPTSATSSLSAGKNAYAAAIGTPDIAHQNNKAAQPASAAGGHHQPGKFNTFALSSATL
jgi:hypothetical protein